FCQRVLREHALESGQLFDAELTDDLVAIKQSCADDFWRKQVYNRSAWEAAVLTTDYKTPDDLLASVDFIAAHVTIYPPYEDLDQALNNLQQVAAEAKGELDACAATLQSSFAEGKFKTSFSDAFAEEYTNLKCWLHGDNVDPPESDELALLTRNSLLEALNGNKFRGNKDQTSEQRKADYLAELAINTAPFDALAEAVKKTTLLFRRTLLENLRTELDKRLQQLNALSFDGLITRLADALQSDKGALLTTELQTRFAVALIDEFQDTDDQQWFIFSSVFAAPSQYLYLIGDPKQAIYKFRGADIYAYLDAQKQAEHHFTLGKNWRSHPQLVEAVNSLLQREQAFLLKDLAFYKTKPAKSADDGALYLANQAIAPMALWQLPQSDSKTGYWIASKAADNIKNAVVNEVVDLLMNDYKLQPAGRRLQPQDIAILVRTNTQAREYQAALRAVGAPSVLNSTESVFATQEAVDLHTLLQAVATPGDSGLLKQALSLSWFGLDGQAFYQLINNETSLDAWISGFLGYYQDWQKAGLMTMMQNLLNKENIKATIAKTLMAERQLTNLYHLTELLQQAAVDEHMGITKTLSWLRTAISKASDAENQQLRLESDDNALQIVTMHRSKGLEYPIVFCPCLWQRSDRLTREKHLIKCHADGEMIADLGSEDFEQHRAQALDEELAEDLRLFYVAVTRAQYRCYIAWADARSEKKPNNSALAWLLNFTDSDFSSQQATLQAFSQQSAPAFAYQLLEAPNDIIKSYRKSATTHQFAAKKRQRSLYTHWQMSSYTALSALSQQDAPELPEDKAREQQDRLPKSPELLPPGANTGNVVHDLLENNAFNDLAKRKNISAQRDKICQRYGLKLEQPELLDDLLQAVVQTPLSITEPRFCLMNLPEKRCLKEMPFYLAMQVINASQINDILQDTPAYQPLTSKQMSGYLTGFIDLICEYQGRYYVMDYKTNNLPDYHNETMTLAMREHNYGLQYWLYTVVLHRYLQNRLPDFDYETHFGGVRYLFVRGMRPEVAMSGVYQDRPDWERIKALAELFGGDAC
ncbi:MAG: exodeoxyribonuclease V subunit beta, partial [Methylovulum sp.]